METKGVFEPFIGQLELQLQILEKRQPNAANACS